MCVDDCLYMEAFESLLESWAIVIVVSDPCLFPADFFGRYALSHSLPLLSRLLEDRTNKLKDLLNRLVNQQGSFNISDVTSVDNLYEDLHWLVLIAGHVLCMEADGETPLVPSEIMRYSMEQAQSGQMDLNITLQLLASPQSNLADINGAEQSADHVIRLIAAVFRLSETAKIAINYNAAQHLSPELCSTIIWFLHRWSLSYSIPNESIYQEMSTTILQAFGEDTPGSLWTMNFLVDKIQCNIKAFKGEPTLVKEIMQLLVALVGSTPKASVLVKTDGYNSLVELATKAIDLPQKAKRGLMRAVIRAGLVYNDSDKFEQYYAQILMPLQNRFKEIICHADFPRNYHQEEIRVQIMDILESFIGTAKSVTNSNIWQIYQYTSNVLNELPRLINIYHNYQQLVQLILELFCECSRNMLYFLQQPDNFLEICLHVLQSYANCNQNRLTVDSTAEEDAYQDILIIMMMLTNLLSKDFLNLNPEVSESDGQNQQLPLIVNVFLFGLNIIMPMMTMDLLKFPSLCIQYFKMITFFCEIHPEKVCSLPPEMLQQLMISVELGLFSFGNEVTNNCCDIIQIMAKHIYTEVEKGRPRNDLMAPFMNLLMNLIITHQINSDLVSNTSVPFYYLICCYQEKYQQLVQTMISEQADPTTAQRLAAAFNELTANVTLNTDRAHRLRFRDNFDKFIINVQGFLMVK